MSAVFARYRLEVAKAVMRENENALLCESPSVCALADSWAAVESMHSFDTVDLHQTCPTLCAALDDIERKTRESPLRKVKP